MILKKFILLCLLLASARILQAQDSETRTRDSLLGCLAVLPHDTLRLQTYLNLVQVSQNNMDESRRYNEELLAEAELQKNDRYICEAYFTQIVHAYNIYDTEKVHSVFAKLEPVARRSKNYDLLFRGWRCSTDMRLLDQDYQKNEREAQRMMREAEKLNSTVGVLEAYQCLGNLYRVTYRRQEAAEILEKALPLAIQQGRPGTVNNIWQSLVFLYYELQDHENWLRTLREFEAYTKKHYSEDPYQGKGIYVILYTSYLEYYTSTKDYAPGERYLKLAEKYLQEIDSPLYDIYFNSTAAKYYNETHQFEKALAKINLVLDHRKKNLVSDLDYYFALSQKADLLDSLHRSQEALPLYKTIRRYHDSMQIVTIDKQYEQLKKDFNADTLLLEQAKIQHRIRLFTISLLLIGLLGVVCFTIYLLRSRRFLQRAKQETQRMTDRMQLANEAKDRFLSNVNDMIREPLNTVVEGSLRLAGEEIQDPAQRQAFSAGIRRMSTNLLQLINDILDLSRLEAGMMKYSPSQIEITAMLQDAVRASDNDRESTDIRLVLDYPAGALFMAEIDGNRLLEVFTSLCANTARGCDRIILTIHGHQAGIELRIMGSALAETDPPQAVIIRNEINRMFIEHFGGKYEVHAATTPPTITINLPTEVVYPSEKESIKG